MSVNVGAVSAVSYLSRHGQGSRPSRTTSVIVGQWPQCQSKSVVVEIWMQPWIPSQSPYRSKLFPVSVWCGRHLESVVSNVGDVDIVQCQGQVVTVEMLGYPLKLVCMCWKMKLHHPACRRTPIFPWRPDALGFVFQVSPGAERATFMRLRQNIRIWTVKEPVLCFFKFARVRKNIRNNRRGCKLPPSLFRVNTLYWCCFGIRDTAYLMGASSNRPIYNFSSTGIGLKSIHAHSESCHISIWYR